MIFFLISNGVSSMASQLQCITALLYVTNQWFQLLEEGQEVCAVFFDIQIAFDTVPHRPLLNKLRSIGIDSKFSQSKRFLSKLKIFLLKSKGCGM